MIAGRIHSVRALTVRSRSSRRANRNTIRTVIAERDQRLRRERVHVSLTPSSVRRPSSAFASVTSSA